MEHEKNNERLIDPVPFGKRLTRKSINVKSFQMHEKI
jgi:hypothetical protein